MLSLAVVDDVNDDDNNSPIRQQPTQETRRLKGRPYGALYHNQRLPAYVSMLGLGCSSFSHFFDAPTTSTSNNTATTTPSNTTEQQENDTNLTINGDGTSDNTHDNSTTVPPLTMETLSPDHPRVQIWIQTVVTAYHQGITLWDTAPWYGHGMSEIVLGWAWQHLLQQQSIHGNDEIQDSNGNSLRKSTIDRSLLCIQAKVGRYEADPAYQFDFTYAATIASVQRSLQRLQCEYLDVVQLHDPEFAPSLDILMNETIPALLHCQSQGWCRALGMTGYPLAVQHQILEASRLQWGRIVFDQALTYAHCNLHDASVLLHRFIPPARTDDPTQALTQSSESDTSSTKDTLNATLAPLWSFVDYCHHYQVVVLNAAPLSMGLLTPQGPPAWHPAPTVLQDACRQAHALCSRHATLESDNFSHNPSNTNTTIAQLALLVALAAPPPKEIACTILGMATPELVLEACNLMRRVEDALSSFDTAVTAIQSDEHAAAVTSTDMSTSPSLLDYMCYNQRVQKVLTASEYRLYQHIMDVQQGPFAEVWKEHDKPQRLYQWDGAQEAQRFWQQLCPNEPAPNWQAR
jgi:L-galactose dehydrogenase